MKVFVTVGSTDFDSLIQCLDEKSVQNALFELGFDEILLQIGRGTFLPNMNFVGDAEKYPECVARGAKKLSTRKSSSNKRSSSMKLEFYRYKPSLAQDMAEADLIIGHAGSGTILETLRALKQMIVVVNDTLMDNHQMELARKMGELNYVLVSSPAKLLSTIESELSGFDQRRALQPQPQTQLFWQLLIDELIRPNHLSTNHNNNSNVKMNFQTKSSSPGVVTRSKSKQKTSKRRLVYQSNNNDDNDDNDDDNNNNIENQNNIKNYDGLFGKKDEKNVRKLKTMIVLGSGGHTSEMTQLMATAPTRAITPRCYVLATSDHVSEPAMWRAENVNNISGSSTTSSVHVCRIPRSREVKQSYVTSVWTTLVALFACFSLLWRERPQLLLVNGPGTSLPVVLVAKLLSTLRLTPHCDVVFFESVARINSLSLTGKILLKLRLCSLFLVQWQELQQKYPSQTKLIQIFF